MCNLQHCFVRTPSGSCIIHIQSKESVMVCARALVLCQMLLMHCSRIVCNTKGGGVTIAFWVVFQRIICYVPRIAPAPSSVHNGFLDGRYPGAKAYSHPCDPRAGETFRQGRVGSQPLSPPVICLVSLENVNFCEGGVLRGVCCPTATRESSGDGDGNTDGLGIGGGEGVR